MTTKITLIIDHPANPEEFDHAFATVLAAANGLPGLQRMESAKVWPKEDGTPTPAFRTLDLYFASYGEASAAVASPAAGDVFGGIIGTGVTFTGLFSEIE